MERDEGKGKEWRGIEWEVKDGDGMKGRKDGEGLNRR